MMFTTLQATSVFRVGGVRAWRLRPINVFCYANLSIAERHGCSPDRTGVAREPCTASSPPPYAACGIGLSMPNAELYRINIRQPPSA
jgi:hypothetical protein